MIIQFWVIVLSTERNPLAVMVMYLCFMNGYAMSCISSYVILFFLFVVIRHSVSCVLIKCRAMAIDMFCGLLELN